MGQNTVVELPDYQIPATQVKFIPHAFNVTGTLKSWTSTII